MGYEITTGGDLVIGFAQCDCGLAGGCPRCCPRILPRKINCEDFIPLFNEIAEPYYIFPETHEEKFISSDLMEFYKKRGLGG